MDQSQLKHTLDQTVESCVNLVGVNLNTASQHLLTYVSGLGPVLAQNIVDYRKENGAFTSRAQLKKVPRLGPAAYQQCAGFLRIPDAKNPLDNSAVHPESYHVVEQMAKDQHCCVSDLISDATKRSQIDIKQYVTDEVGLPTLTDIMKELEKPGRDPREQIEEFEFDNSVQTIEDLHEGMELPGIVTNITNFGAFVDIGVHQDGLVHVSQLANKYVTKEVGLPTLTDIMKELEKPGRDPREQIEEFEFDSSVQTVEDLHEGMELPGIVTNITNFGAFVDIGVHQDGLVHVSQLADRYVSDPTQVVRLHQHVRVRVIAVDLRRNRISLSMKGMK